MLNINDIENNGYFYAGMSEEAATFLNEHIQPTGTCYPKDNFIVNEMKCATGQKFFYQSGGYDIRIQRANKYGETFGVGEIVQFPRNLVRKYFIIPTDY